MRILTKQARAPGHEGPLAGGPQRSSEALVRRLEEVALLAAKFRQADRPAEPEATFTQADLDDAAMAAELRVREELDARHRLAMRELEEETFKAASVVLDDVLDAYEAGVAAMEQAMRDLLGRACQRLLDHGFAHLAAAMLEDELAPKPDRPVELALAAGDPKAGILAHLVAGGRHANEAELVVDPRLRPGQLRLGRAAEWLEMDGQRWLARLEQDLAPAPMNVDASEH